MTCSTFALYTASFTKSASQALSLAAADAPDGEKAMAKRWDFLSKFETNFNHWSVGLARILFDSLTRTMHRFKVCRCSVRCVKSQC